MSDPFDQYPGDGKFRNGAGDTEREAAGRVSRHAMYPKIIRVVREHGPEGGGKPMSTCCVQRVLKDYYGEDYTHDQLSNRISELVKGEGLPNYMLYRVGKDVRANRNYDKTYKMSMQYVHTTIAPLPKPMFQDEYMAEEKEEYLEW